MNIKNPDDWAHVLQGEKLVFDAPAPRRVKLTINSTGHASVWVAKTEEMDGAVLVGAGSGMFDVQFSTDERRFVELRTQDGAVMFVKGHAPSHKVESRDLPSLTVIAPRGRPSELQRAMYVMKLNERAREAKLEAELKRLSAARTVENADPGPQGSVEEEAVAEASQEQSDVATEG